MTSQVLVIVGSRNGLRPDWALIRSKPLPKPILCRVVPLMISASDEKMRQNEISRIRLSQEKYNVKLSSFIGIRNSQDCALSDRLALCTSIVNQLFFNSLAQNTAWNRISKYKIRSLHVVFQSMVCYQLGNKPTYKRRISLRLYHENINITNITRKNNYIL